MPGPLNDQSDSVQQGRRGKEFSWLCFVASISLTVIENNPESGPELSLSLLGFLPWLAAILCMLQGMKTGLHLISLSRMLIGYIYI